MFRGALLGGLCSATILIAGAPAADAASKVCSDPTADWQRAAPSELGLNGNRLKAALKLADDRLSQSALVIRHGCLAGISPNGQMNYYSRAEAFSMSKSMVSMAAQRAMTMGLLSPDDRLGALVPEADRAHGNITIRQLLEMTAGLHWDLLGDYGNVFNPDIITNALELKFDHEPGTWFEYHQASVTLLTKAIERAVGKPFQDFIQDELFGPIGIKRSSWTWATDNTGTTAGFYGLQLPAPDFARLGLLMLRQGSWNGRRLIDPWYVAAARSRTATNPGYGWLFWRNDPDGYVGGTITGRYLSTEPDMPALPMDAYEMNGLADQQVVIIPSLDTVYVRMGLPNSDLTAPDQDFAGWFGSREGAYTISRALMQAFDDPQVPDPGPFPKESKTDISNLPLHPEVLIPLLAETKPPLPKAGPARGRVPIPQSGVVTVAPSGIAGVPLSCPPVGPAECRASIMLTSPNGRPWSSPGRVTLTRGDSGRATVRVSAATRRKIAAAAAGALSARVTLFVGDAVSRWSSAALPPITLTLQERP